MNTWYIHLIPSRNTMKLYRRTGDLTQIKTESSDGRRTINHNFGSIHRNEWFDEAEKILIESGYTIVSGWERDLNFEIWHIKAVEKVSELVD